MTEIIKEKLNSTVLLFGVCLSTDAGWIGLDIIGLIRLIWIYTVRPDLFVLIFKLFQYFSVTYSLFIQMFFTVCLIITAKFDTCSLPIQFTVIIIPFKQQ